MGRRTRTHAAPEKRSVRKAEQELEQEGALLPHPTAALPRLAAASSTAMRPTNILALQGTLGNQAVQRILAENEQPQVSGRKMGTLIVQRHSKGDKQSDWIKKWRSNLIKSYTKEFAVQEKRLNSIVSRLAKLRKRVRQNHPSLAAGRQSIQRKLAEGQQPSAGGAKMDALVIQRHSSESEESGWVKDEFMSLIMDHMVHFADQKHYLDLMDKKITKTRKLVEAHHPSQTAGSRSIQPKLAEGNQSKAGGTKMDALVIQRHSEQSKESSWIKTMFADIKYDFLLEQSTPLALANLVAKKIVETAKWVETKHPSTA